MQMPVLLVGGFCDAVLVFFTWTICVGYAGLGVGWLTVLMSDFLVGVHPYRIASSGSGLGAGWSSCFFCLVSWFGVSVFQ